MPQNAMSKRQQKIDPRQMSLEDLIAQAGNQNPAPERQAGGCDVRAQLAGLMNEAIRESGKSRDEIADAMNTLLGLATKQITSDQINTWTRTTAPRYIPLEYIYAFERATDTCSITEYLCKLHGGRFVDRHDDAILSLGQIQYLKNDLIVRERQIKRRLGK